MGQRVQIKLAHSRVHKETDGQHTVDIEVAEEIGAEEVHPTIELTRHREETKRLLPPYIIQVKGPVEINL